MSQKLYFILKPSKIKNQYYVDNPFDKQPYKLENMLKQNEITKMPTLISNPDLNEIFTQQKYKMMRQNQQLSYIYGNDPYKPKIKAPNEFTSAYSRRPEVNDLLDKNSLNQQNKLLDEQYKHLADEFIDEAKQYNQKIKRELQQLQYQLQVDQKYVQLTTSSSGLAQQCEFGVDQKYLNDGQLPILPDQTTQKPNLFTDKYINKIDNDYVINYKPVDVDAILRAARNQQEDLLEKSKTHTQVLSLQHPKSPSPPRTTVNMTASTQLPGQTIKISQPNTYQQPAYYDLTKSDYELLHTGKHLLSSEGIQQELTQVQKYIQEVTKPKEQKAYISEMYENFTNNLLNLQHNSGQSELLSQKAHFATILQSEREKQVGTDLEQQHAIQALLYRIKELEDQQISNPSKHPQQASQGQSLQSVQTVIQNSQGAAINSQVQLQNDLLNQQLQQSQQLMAQQEAHFRQMLQQQQQQHELQQQALLQQITDIRTQQLQNYQIPTYQHLVSSVVKGDKPQSVRSSSDRGDSSSSHVQSVQYNRQVDDSPEYQTKSKGQKIISGREILEQPKPPMSNGSNTSAFSSTPASIASKQEQKQIDLLRVGDMSLSRISVNNSKATAITNQRDPSLEPQDADPLLKQFVKAKAERTEPQINPQDKQKIENEVKAAFQKKQALQQQQQLGGIISTQQMPAPIATLETSLDSSLLPPKRPGSNSQLSMNNSLQAKKEGMSSLFIDLEEPEKLYTLPEVHEGGLQIEINDNEMFNNYVKSKPVRKDSLEAPLKTGSNEKQDDGTEHKKKRKKKAKGIGPMDAAKIKTEDSINIPL